MCVPAIAKDSHSNGHSNGHGNSKGKSARISKNYKHNGNAHSNNNAYRNANPNASFKRDLDRYGYSVVGKIDRKDYDCSIVLDHYDNYNNRYVRIRTPENNIVTVINDTLQIIDILSI